MSRAILSADEKRDLARYEKIIERGLTTFVDVGEALMAIRDRHLYIGSGCITFKEYCQTRWGFSDSRARQLIDGAKAAKGMAADESDDRVEGCVTTVTHPSPPRSERITRELTRVPKGERASALRETVERCGGEDKVTAAAVRETVEKRKGYEVGPRVQESEVCPNERPLPAEPAPAPEPQPKPARPTLVQELKAVCERWRANGLTRRTIKLAVRDLADSLPDK